MLSDKEAGALVRVLSLAENHPMWTQGGYAAEFKEETYEAISEVRRFLKREGIMTLHELGQRLAKFASPSPDA